VCFGYLCRWDGSGCFVCVSVEGGPELLGGSERSRVCAYRARQAAAAMPSYQQLHRFNRACADMLVGL